MSTHKKISWAKSVIRIAGCLLGMFAFWDDFVPMHAFAFFLVAELLGIWEEWNLNRVYLR